MKLFTPIFLSFLAACGSETDGNKFTGSPVPPVTDTPPETPRTAPVPSEPDAPKETPTVPVVTPPTVLEDRYVVRFYYVMEDEIVDPSTCEVESRGLDMEFQMKNLTKDKFDVLKARSSCEITGVQEASQYQGKTIELTCDLDDNFIWLDQSCGGNTVKYRHHYRPNLVSWGTSAMPEPGYDFGGTSQ